MACSSLPFGQPGQHWKANIRIKTEKGHHDATQQVVKLGCQLLQAGLYEKVQRSRKQLKERKNRSLKVRGIKKNAGNASAIHALSVHAQASF